jgi:hypothetical protein
MKKLLSSVVNIYMQVPSMRLCVCNMCEFSIRIPVCEISHVSCDYLFVYLPELVCCVFLRALFLNVFLSWTGYSFYDVFLSLSVVYSCVTSNIGLWVSMCVSFIFNPSLLVLYTWYFSNVFRWFHCFSIFTTFIASVILPYAWPMFNIRLEYPELPLLCLIACICPFYMVWNVRPACPFCFSGKSTHLTWYTPIFILVYLQARL